MMHKKSKGFLGLLLYFFMVGSPAYADVTTQFIKSSLLVGVGLGALGQAEEWFVLDNLSKKFNMSTEDIRSILVASIALFGLGCLPMNDNIKITLKQWGFRAPFFAGLAGFVSSKFFKNVLAKIPYLGTYLGACLEPDCKGSCNQCKVRTAAMTVLLWQSLANRPVTYLENTHVGVRCGLSVGE